ncbi:MAG: alanine/glycine:cation symporter family protein, partial [Planctomycetota bacterium JB042]
RGKYDNPGDHGEVTHFQALSAALSATVGLGNIAGVAIAVSIGGPGATVWMIVAGLLGMSLKFTECSLGQHYRRIDADGRVSGGPMHYLRDGLKEKGFGSLGVVLAIVFTIFCIGGSLAGGNSFQVNQSLGILKDRVPFFEEYDWVYGVGMAVMVGVVIIGGIRRIAQTAEKIVPTMCALYVAAALTIIVTHIADVPAAFETMFSAAFTGDAVYGGAIGALIQGFRRAAFSNEAGVGSAAIAHSAARTEYPVREGIVALLEPFIDTVVVCTMTALVIVITGVYDYTNPAYTDMVAGKEGAALTLAAFSEVSFLAGWFPWLLMVAVILFAFSTMISWSYYGERCWTSLFGAGSSMAYKMLFLVFVVLGSVISAQNVLEFGDLMILLMAFPNILGLYFLGGVVKRGLDEYETKLKNGEFKVFD